MKSWKLVGPGQLTMEESAPTVLQQGFVKVKVEEILFSSLDLCLYNGTFKRKYPFVLGRNAVGVVSEGVRQRQVVAQKNGQGGHRTLHCLQPLRRVSGRGLRKMHRFAVHGAKQRGVVQKFC